MIEAGAPTVASGAEFRLGPWTVQPALHRLCDGDTTCQVGHKVMAVLLLLAQEPGRVVRKDELIEAVWDGAFTSDEALTTVVYELRKALGDDARQPRFVETIRKGGYRLVAPVEPVATADSPAVDSPAVDRAEVAPQVTEGVETEIPPPASALPESVPEVRKVARKAAAPVPASARPASPPRPVSPPRTAEPLARRLPSLAWVLGGVAVLVVLWITGRSIPAGEASSGASATPPARSDAASLPVATAIEREPLAPPSLAVLPLASFGEQCRQDSFAGGLTEMLIADLAASVPMEVLPSLSTRVVDDRWSLDDVATKLHADLVVEGTVVQAGERMWLSVQLVDIASGKMLWGGSYERSLDDSLEQQRALALEIAEEVGRYATPLPTDRPDLALPPAAAP